MMKHEYSLANDGFMVLRGVFSPDILDPIRDLLLEIIPYAERGYADPFSKYYLRHRADQGVLYDLVQRHPEFMTMARNSPILDAVAGTLGPDLLLYENSIVYKPKGKQNGVPFHQDFISRPNEPVKLIAWMAIDRVTKEGGALKVIPGSHRKGFLPWHRVEGETHHDRIDTSALDLTGLTHVELERGDVLIFNQLVVHGSDEMHTDSMRLVYRVSYQSFDEIFVPRGAPMVVRGGRADCLAQRFSQPYMAPKPKGVFRRGVNKIGRVLATL